MAGYYRYYADVGMTALMSFYNSNSGLWESPDYNHCWWHSANVLEAVIDYSLRTKTTAYSNVISNTFQKNKDFNLTRLVNINANFIGNQYDDEGWWALTWIKAYDLTGVGDYLSMAETIFADMQGGWDTTTCGGGIWWIKPGAYKSAIANELFLTIAARLYQRSPANVSYLNWAKEERAWFAQSGLINSQHLINDGLNSNCTNNGQTTWTYNQGVILGALVDMYKITGDGTYISTAEAIADAVLNPANQLVDSNSILREPCESSASGCGFDGPQFKGIFMRNLSYLYEADPTKGAYKNFITRNADSIYLNNRNPANQFGLHWAGPVDTADAVRQSSAMDALIAAIPFDTSTYATVPNLLGQSPTDAQSIAQQAGLGMLITGTVLGLDGPTVYSQQPAPGTSVPPGTTIDVVVLVSRRPPP